MNLVIILADWAINEMLVCTNNTIIFLVCIQKMHECPSSIIFEKKMTTFSQFFQFWLCTWKMMKTLPLKKLVNFTRELYGGWKLFFLFVRVFSQLFHFFFQFSIVYTDFFTKFFHQHFFHFFSPQKIVYTLLW